MSYNKVNWKDYPNTETPVTAANLNHMDDQIKANADKIEEMEEAVSAVKLTGTLTAGQTTLTFTNAKIKSGALIEVYTEPVVNYNSISTNNNTHQCVITWDAQASDMAVAITIK